MLSIIQRIPRKPSTTNPFDFAGSTITIGFILLVILSLWLYSKWRYKNKK